MNNPLQVRPTSQGAAAVVVVEHGRILLVQHAYGDRAWHLPGGKMELGEAPWSTARRELEEEVGLVADRLAMTGVYEFRDFGVSRLRYAFVAKEVRDEPRVVDPMEIAEFRWFEPLDLPRPLASFAWHAARDVFATTPRRFASYSTSRISELPPPA